MRRDALPRCREEFFCVAFYKITTQCEPLRRNVSTDCDIGFRDRAAKVTSSLFSGRDRDEFFSIGLAVAKERGEPGTPRGVPGRAASGAVAMTRAEVAGTTGRTTDALATLAGAGRIHGAGVGGSAHEGARGEQDGYGTKDESLHRCLLAVQRLSRSPQGEPASDIKT
jgi:hypothetical protein